MVIIKDGPNANIYAQDHLKEIQTVSNKSNKCLSNDYISKFITFTHADMKSLTNFSFASSQA